MFDYMANSCLLTKEALGKGTWGVVFYRHGKPIKIKNNLKLKIVINLGNAVYRNKINVRLLL